MITSIDYIITDLSFIFGCTDIFSNVLCLRCTQHQPYDRTTLRKIIKCNRKDNQYKSNIPSQHDGMKVKWYHRNDSEFLFNIDVSSIKPAYYIYVVHETSICFYIVNIKTEKWKTMRSSGKAEPRWIIYLWPQLLFSSQLHSIFMCEHNMIIFFIGTTYSIFRGWHIFIPSIFYHTVVWRALTVYWTTDGC